MPFRVIHSTISPEDVGCYVGSHYPVGGVAACRLLKRRFNDTYEIVTENRDKFIFRIGARRSHGHVHIEYETAFLSHLSQQAVPVAMPVCDTAGRMWHMINFSEGPRPVVLFTHTLGRSPNISADDASAQGATLAHVHVAGESFRATPDRQALNLEHLLRRPLEKLFKLPILTGPVRSYLGNLADRLGRRVESVEQHLTRVHCHGDCHGWNARILDEPGPVASFFDFDDCGPGWMAYDLAVFLWSTKTYDEGARSHQWPHFIEGYRRFRPIPMIDFDLIPTFVAIRNFWLMGEYAERSDEWGSELFDEMWLERQVDFLAQWERVHI